MCVLGADADKRMRRIALNDNDIVCSEEMTEALGMYAEEVVTQQKERRLGEVEAEKEKEEIERRGMFQVS